MSISKRKRWWKAIGTACATVILFAGNGAIAGEHAELDVIIERVALFKNGLGYFTSSATLPNNASTIEIQRLPVPSHGTFWVGYPGDVQVKALVSSTENVEGTVPAKNLTELLRANTGKKVTVTTAGADNPSITGRLRLVTGGSKVYDQSGPYIRDVRSSSSISPYQPLRTSELVVIETNGGSVVLDAGSIIRVDFKDEDLETSVADESKRPGIRLELERPAGGTPIGVSYLARGITWAPSYMLDISDPDKARLSAKAIVMNEVADLNNIHLDLVTGYPNIQFGDINSPVSMSQNLEGFLRALSGGRGRARSDLMTQQALVSNVVVGMPVGDPLGGAPAYSTAPKGEVTEDLFLYPVEAFSLNRGQTAYLPLFTAEIPYEHIYVWKIPDMLDEIERYRRQDDEQPKGEEVWHSCRLTNNMDMPWTTAPAEFVKNGQFVGQDICYYTPPGAETTIRINRAMNVIAEEAEVELERERNAAKFHGYSYDLIKVQGKLQLTNRLGKTATVEVTKNLSGDVLETVPEARDVPTAKGLKRVNPRHVLVWEIELKAGEERTIVYTYEVYVRN